MRSWTGILQLAQPQTYGGSHLQALVDILYLNNNEVRVSLFFLQTINLGSILPTQSQKNSWNSAQIFSFQTILGIGGLCKKI